MRSFLQNLFFGIYVLILVGFFGAVGIYQMVKDQLPQLPDSLDKIALSLPTEVYSADGEVMKVLGERHPVSLNEVSPHFTKAIVATEDSRFFDHHGIDHIGLVRAIIVNVSAGRVVQGASTITQQLSKNLFFAFDRVWIRKFKELLIAFQMESAFSKEEILEAYCNQVYFGSGAYGVEEASLLYFGKRARDLTLLQAAMLAGLPNAPNHRNPYMNLDRAMERTRYVLNRLVKLRFITQGEMNATLNEPLGLVPVKQESNPNLYFVNFVLSRLEEKYGKEFVHFGGLKIFTTLDSRYQRFAQRSVETHLTALEKRLKPELDGVRPLQAALVSVENKTGAVRAMLGGRKYSQSQFNRAVSNVRMPGSSFKPFVYFTAMEHLGLNPASIVVDEAVTIPVPGSKPWQPKNFNDQYDGPIVLKKALMRSLNVVSAKLIHQVTPQRVIRTARQFGITSHLGPHLSLALGTSGVSPLEMASAYSAIANLGVVNEPYMIQRVEDYRGIPLYEHFYHGVQKFSQKAIYPLLDMMSGVVDQGTGRVVRRMGFKHPAGGKTGTTNDFKDAWFNGFTKDLSTSVWVGKDNNLPMLDKNDKGITGASAAAPIWTYFMQKALEGKAQVKFPVPDGIRFARVEANTGYLATANSPNPLEVAIKLEAPLRMAPLFNETMGSSHELVPAPPVTGQATGNGIPGF